MFLRRNNRHIPQIPEIRKSLGRFKDGSYPYIYRCWMKDGVIVAKYPVSAYGGICSSIKYADECIAEKLNRS